MSWKQGSFRGRFARSSESAPLARTDELIVEDLAAEAGGVDEVLIYDQRNDQAHCLTREAAMVWRVCDGQTAPVELAKALSLDIDVVSRALDELAACELLDVGFAGGLTRREATMRMAKVGGAVAAAPLIYSILAPSPALAASQNFCLNLSCPPGTPPGECGCTGATYGGKTGCDACFKAGCVCCGAGSSGTGGGVKLCTADCTCTYCSPDIIHNHCGTCGNEATCTGGPNGPNGKCDTGAPAGC